MRFLRDISIRQKLQAIVMLTCGVALLLAAFIFAGYDRVTFLQSNTQDLSTTAKMIGENCTAALSFGDAVSASEILTGLRVKEHVLFAAIYNKNGAVFAKYSRDSAHGNFSPPPPQKDGTAVIGGHKALFQGIILKDETIGTIYIEEDLGELNGRLIRFVAIALAVLLASLTVAFFLSSNLQKIISGPIRELAETASAVSAHENYSIRATKTSEDEIGLLFDQFNSMLDRIQQRDVDLQHAHTQLESRVDERTRELQKEIVERKRAEEELEKQKAFLNSLIENSPVAIVAMDHNFCVQMCNPAFENLFLYSQEQILGRSLPELIEKHGSRVDLNLQAEMTVHRVVKGSRSDGSFIDIEVLAVPLFTEGKVTGRLALFQDVTARQRSEEAMRRAKEAAEAASRAKSEFLANMSHEIRTPINGIMGMTELVLDTELNAEQRNYLSLAKLSADSLLSLINDILDYSKIEAGKLDIDAIDFNLDDSFGDTMKTLGLRAHQKGIELAFEIEPDVPNALIGDPERLRQIIVNLVGNGIKFTDQGEVVLYVKTKLRSEEEIELHFTVTDTGIGIPAEKQTAIFDAFQQADGSMTRKYGGTGLGLTISSQLVQLMRGKIWVESEGGKGSRFHFTARFGLQKVPATTTVFRDRETLRNMRVLVVDDNATNRQILSKVLQNWHMAPTVIASGAEAIVALGDSVGTGRTFPLILLDAQMPEMDGFALAEAIKRNPDWSAATIMMLSSAGQRGDAIRCRELGIAAYLTKPVRQRELLDAILLALGTGPRDQEPAPALVTRHSLRENRNPVRILLVEDNAVNQLVALRLLEKRGHVVGVASNGKKALEALEKESYDLILMDVQMPEMNGWEATEAIRRKEKTTGGHIPIVAMTAHAMKGDDERCFAAGMDHYLTKPIRTQELFAVVDEIGSRKEGPKRTAGTASRNPVTDAIDLAATLERLDGDRGLFDALTQIFKEDCPRAVESMRRAITLRDAKGLEQHAHSLKGSSANLGALAVSQAAGEVERLARVDNVEGTAEQFKVLRDEIERLFSQLESLQEK